MKTLTIKLLLALLLVVSADFAAAESAARAWIELVGERQKNKPAYAYVRNNPDLPNVLIYGDSISIDYTQRVRTNLADTANVYRLYCNGSDSSTVIPAMTRMHRTMRNKELDEPWTFEWDVIQFNVGLHDLKYMAHGKLDIENGEQVNSIEQYKKNLKAIIAYLKELAPNAQLIFATTTPVPENARGRVAGDAARYNAAALEVLREYPEVHINDLYALTKPNFDDWAIRPGDVHFNEKGFKAQGDAVAKVIADALIQE